MHYQLEVETAELTSTPKVALAEYKYKLTINAKIMAFISQKVFYFNYYFLLLIFFIYF